MTTRLVIQLMFIGIVLGYKCYKIDNKIAEREIEPYPIRYWVCLWLVFPITFMFFAFLDALNKKS